MRCDDAQKGTKVDKRKPKEGNVTRRDLKKEGKKKNKRRLYAVCLCSKGQLSATRYRSDRSSSSDQLSQPAGRIADSQPRIVENGAACYTFDFVPSIATAPPNPGFPSISTFSESHGDAPPTGAHPARPSVTDVSAPFSRSRCCCCSSSCCCSSCCCAAPFFFPRRPPPSPA